jgi:hypothetical protein
VIITSQSLLQWHSIGASAWRDELTSDEDWFGESVALDSASTPEWLQRLSIPQEWQSIDVTGLSTVPVVRASVRAAEVDAGWVAAQAVSVFEFTKWPTFREALDITAGPLYELGVRDVVTKVLPMPLGQQAMAVRSSGIAVPNDEALPVGDCGRVWVQQTSLVAGSEEQRAGRVLLHNVFVDGERRQWLGQEVAQVSDKVYQEFLGSLEAQDF